MIWPFSKSKHAEQFAVSVVKAAAQGAERARVVRALATVGLQLDTKLDDEQFCVKAVIAIVRELAQASRQTPIWIDDDHRFTAGIFAFTLSNSLSYRLGSLFETVSTQAALILTSVGTGDDDDFRDVDDLASVYNDLTTKGRIVEAIGTTFSRWLVTPTRDNYSSLAKLYSTLGGSVTSTE